MTKDELFQKASCTDKVRLVSEREAKAAAGKTRGNKRFTYKCQLCDGWHVTSEKGTSEQRKAWRAAARRLAKAPGVEHQHVLDGRFAAERKAGRR